MAEISKMNHFLVLYFQEQIAYFNRMLMNLESGQLCQFNGELFNQFLHIFMRTRKLSVPEFSRLSGIAPITLYRLSGKQVIRLQQQTVRKILNYIEEQVNLSNILC